MISIADAVARAVLSGTKDYAAIKKKQERDQRQADRLTERYRQGRSFRLTIKDAAWAAIPAAYNKASGGGKYPANARQVMYAARPAIQEQTGQSLNDTYFTQTLLPDYVKDHPEETAEWDIVYDARGHLWEPHTNRQISLGTLGVRKYLQQMDAPLDLDLELSFPQSSRKYPTNGPQNRFGAILYIEKEGFLPLLEQAQFKERYDLAIMSSKGMGTTAVRTLIESLFEKVTILVLHDFDKSGFSILGTLTRDTRRYEYIVEPDVVDLGLRLDDVNQWDLQAEDVFHTSDPFENLDLNGATSEEASFLRGKRFGTRGFAGRRVELNAFSSDAFVEWLEAKLQQHQVSKVIPDAATIEGAYRRAAAVRRYEEIIEAAGKEIADYAASLKVPKNLKEKLGKAVAKNPTLAWDQALVGLLPRR